MATSWHAKKAKLAEAQALKDEEEARNAIDFDAKLRKDLTEAAMGGGDKELFEKKLSKEEKKARAKEARDTKKKAKMKASGVEMQDDEVVEEDTKPEGELTETVAGSRTAGEDGIDYEQADKLTSEGTICTFAASRKGVDARSRDIKVENFTLQHKGNVMLDETEIVLNHGNRYGLIGRNGCGKSTFLKAIGARAVPVARSIDIFFLKEEVEASDTLTALEAVMSVDQERMRLEATAEELNQLLATLAEKEGADEDGKSPEEIQEEVMETLTSVYERLDALDAETAEVRARSILKGLGFTHEMQSKKTKDFSGGWRMRVSLARALFIQPVCLLLDEPTNQYVKSGGKLKGTNPKLMYSLHTLQSGYGSCHLVGRLPVALGQDSPPSVTFPRFSK